MSISRQRHPVYFIAEIGQNHQGDINIAKKMVDSLKGTAVSCIKTAKRDIDICLTEEQKNAPYDNPNSFGETYYEHRKNLELSKEDFVKLYRYSKESGFDFCSSYTDLNSLDFLCEVGVDALKIASQRMDDVKLLSETSHTKLPIIVSTGMSDWIHVDRAVDIFYKNEKYLLQCTSTYPCPEKDLNLKVIPMLKSRYQGRIDGVGFSGHHIGVAPDIAAYMLGATIIERHYTLDRAMKGTDHAASLEKRCIQYILEYILQVRNSLGSGNKELLPSEFPAMKKLRGLK